MAGAALGTPLVILCMPAPVRAAFLEIFMKYTVKKEAQKRRE